MSEPFLHTLGKCDILPMKSYSLGFFFKWVHQYIKLAVELLFIPGYSIKRGEGFWFCKTFFRVKYYLYTKCVFICCVPHKLINDLHLLICATAKDSKYNWDFENKLNWEFFMIIIILFLYKVSMLYNNDRKKYIYQYILTSENNSNHNFDQKKKYIVIFLSIIHILII